MIGQAVEKLADDLGEHRCCRWQGVADEDDFPIEYRRGRIRRNGHDRCYASEAPVCVGSASGVGDMLFPTGSAADRNVPRMQSASHG